MKNADTYTAIGWIVGALVFLGAWFVASMAIGAQGFMIGWVPSLVLGAVAGAMWPLTLIGLAVLAFLFTV